MNRGISWVRICFRLRVRERSEYNPMLYFLLFFLCCLGFHARMSSCFRRKLLSRLVVLIWILLRLQRKRKIHKTCSENYCQTSVSSFHRKQKEEARCFLSRETFLSFDRMRAIVTARATQTTKTSLKRICINYY